MLEEDYLRRMPDPVFFDSPKAFGKWLAKNHDKATELWVGYHKVHTGKPSLTWPQSVDEALCYGWIDGIRKSLGGDAYMIRFTPRKPTSMWSAVNLTRVPELIAEGRMQPPGLAAYERRTAAKSGIYTYENRPESLDAESERTFKKNKKAWAVFQTFPPYYKRSATWWVVSAKKPETRAKRLAMLIAKCERGERIPAMTPAKKTAR
jgi:uncharacterized protein YdeI (YjbR/CyaY-like superfamily)